MEKVTIKMIAARAGVSIGTVDRALHDRGRIKPETKAEILRLADEMGFRPNPFASALRRRQSLRLAVIMARAPAYFVDELRAGVEEARARLADYNTEIEYVFSDSLDPAEQEELLRGFDHTKFDGVAINTGGERLAPYLRWMADDGVPVVTFNTDVRDSGRICFIGENSYHSGRLAGELMGKLLGGHGTAAVFVGFENLSSHRDRAAGLRDCLREHYPAIRLLDVAEYHDREAEARDIMERLLRDGVCVNGIFCVSTPGAVGVGECLESHRLRNQIQVIGYDVNESSIRLIREGYCSAILYQEPRKQGCYAVLLLHRYLRRTWTPDAPEFYTQTQILLSENIEDYYGAPALEKPVI